LFYLFIKKTCNINIIFRKHKKNAFFLNQFIQIQRYLTIFNKKKQIPATYRSAAAHESIIPASRSITAIRRRQLAMVFEKRDAQHESANAKKKLYKNFFVLANFYCF
jgi:hypothetical protein